MIEVAVLELSDPAEREAFVFAVCHVIEMHCSHRSYDMCRPYFDILRSVRDSFSVELFGGFLECAKYALTHSEKYPAICKCLYNRMCASIVQNEL